VFAMNTRLGASHAVLLDTLRTSPDLRDESALARVLDLLAARRTLDLSDLPSGDQATLIAAVLPPGPVRGGGPDRHRRWRMSIVHSGRVVHPGDRAREQPQPGAEVAASGGLRLVVEAPGEAPRVIRLSDADALLADVVGPEAADLIVRTF